MTALAGLASLQLLGHNAQGQTTSNTLHVSNDGAGSAPDFNALLQLATDFATEFATVYRALSPASWTWDAVVAKQVVPPADTTVPLEATHNVALAGTHTLAGIGVPQAVCVVVAFKTPNASRRFRGHNMLPPLADGGAIDGNNLASSSTWKTAALAYVAELTKGTPTGGGWTGSELSNYGLVIYSRAAQAQSLPSVANVQLVVLRDKIAWLRRREQGAT